MIKIFLVITVLFAFNHIYANDVCSPDSVIELRRQALAEDAVKINDLIKNKKSADEINEALKSYADIYGHYPQVVERMSNSYKDSYLKLVSADGTWEFQRSDGRTFFVQDAFKKYAIKEKPNMDTTTNRYGVKIHKPNTKIKEMHDGIMAKELGANTRENVVIGLGTSKEHAYIIVDGKRLESTGPLFNIRNGRATTTLVDKGTIFEIKSLSVKQKQGIKDYFAKREQEFKTNPIKAHIKNQGCVNTVCAALRDGADIDIKAPIFRQKMLNYLMKNNLVDSNGAHHPVEVYYTNINTSPARRRVRAATRDVAHGGLFGTLGLSVGALAVVVHERVILVSYDKIIEMLGSDENKKEEIEN